MKQLISNPAKYYFRIKIVSVIFLCSPAVLICQIFTDVAASRGLNVVLAPGMGTNGLAIADYDRDGYLDIYFVARASYKENDKRTWNRLFKNNGDANFIDVTTKNIAGWDPDIIQSYMGNKLGASWGDYDNDGYPDLFLTNAGPNQLLHNNGDGTFTDITDNDSLAGGSAQVSTSALWFDYDNDGDLDLYVAVWEDYAADQDDLKNQLFENKGDGHFSNVSVASGTADPGKTWMTVALDVNNDGWLDLYLANDFGANRLYLNNTDKTFSSREEEYNVVNMQEGMGLAIADCDNNGFFDIYLTNVTENGNDSWNNALFLNNGNKSFNDKAVNSGVSHAGWGWGTEFLDYDNDGDEDLFVTNGYFSLTYKNRFFENVLADSLHFNEIGQSLNLADSIEARALAVFDFNRDGRQDILISNFNSKPFLYENNMDAQHWLSISLEGKTSNKNAFGTVIEFVIGKNRYVKYHHGAQFLGQNILPLHFGAGDADMIDSIYVKWPLGDVQVFGPLETNQSILIREGEDIINSLEKEQRTAMVSSFNLYSNYPNPFNLTTTISYSVKTFHGTSQQVNLSIYDIMGKKVATLVNNKQQPGKYSIAFDATGLSSGVYFYSLKTSTGFAQTRKMILMK